MTSEPAEVSVVSDRYWRFEPAEGQDVEGETALLEIGWIPHRLTFVGQGDPPYTVAFGSSTAEPAEQAVAALGIFVDRADDQESTVTLVSTASASDVYTLGGPSRLEPPEPAPPWRLWILWTVMSAGVALLALMVWRLARQMKAAPPD